MQDADMVIREIHMGLWFLVVGYYFFLFIFLFFFRWRHTKNPFQFAMALFFLLLAIGRCFYFIGDYFADLYWNTEYGIIPFLNPTLSVTVQDFWLSAGGFFQWLALAVLSTTAGFMIFGKRWAEIGFAIPAVAIAIALALLPYSMVKDVAGYFGVGYALFLPILFFYLAWQSGGVLRISNFLLGAGFLFLFGGQVIHAGRMALDAAGILGYTVIGVLAPGLIVIGLILVAAGNEWAPSQ